MPAGACSRSRVAVGDGAAAGSRSGRHRTAPAGRLCEPRSVRGSPRRHLKPRSPAAVKRTNERAWTKPVHVCVTGTRGVGSAAAGRRHAGARAGPAGSARRPRHHGGPGLVAGAGRRAASTRGGCRPGRYRRRACAGARRLHAHAVGSVRAEARRSRRRSLGGPAAGPRHRDGRRRGLGRRRGAAGRERAGEGPPPPVGGAARTGRTPAARAVRDHRHGEFRPRHAGDAGRAAPLSSAG